MEIRTFNRTWPGLVLLIIATNGPAYAQSPPGRGPQSLPSIEQDLLARLKGQPIGQGTLESLAVPDEFLRRVADRIIRMDYQKRYRMVLKSDTAQAGSPAGTSDPAAGLGSSKAPTSIASKPALIAVGLGGGVVFLVVLLARRRGRKVRE